MVIFLYRTEWKDCVDAGPATDKMEYPIIIGATVSCLCGSDCAEQKLYPTVTITFPQLKGFSQDWFQELLPLMQVNIMADCTSGQDICSELNKFLKSAEFKT